MFQPMPKEKYKQAGSGPRRFNTLHRILISKKCILAAFLAGMALAALTSPDQVIAQISDLEADQILEDDTQHPWVLEADEIAYDRKLDQYRARGNVKISKADKQLTADFIRFNHKTMYAYAQGNVVLTVGQDILSGSSLEIDLDKQVGSIEDAYLFLKENNFHITGHKIQKTGEIPTALMRPLLPPATGINRTGKLPAKILRLKTMAPARQNMPPCT